MEAKREEQIRAELAGTWKMPMPMPAGADARKKMRSPALWRKPAAAHRP